MLVNELSYYELKNIMKPVIQLQPMSHVVSEIGKVIKISQPTRQKIQEQREFLLRYKGFEMSLSDLRWLRDRGPCISLQFKLQSTKLQAFLNKLFPDNSRLMDLVCGEVIKDLKTICLEEIESIKFASTNIKNAHSYFGSENIAFRVTYPYGVFNFEWKEGRDISPLMITNEFHSNKWFISFLFNAGSFIRNGKQTILRKDWKNNTADISKSINAWVERNYRPNDARKKTFEEWSEDMIIEFGDEIIPSLPEIWDTVYK